MSDSVQLQFEHGIWCLVFSYLCLGLSVASILLMIFISGSIGFIILIAAAIQYFKDAIAISKKEGLKEEKLL